MANWRNPQRDSIAGMKQIQATKNLKAPIFPGKRMTARELLIYEELCKSKSILDLRQHDLLLFRRIASYVVKIENIEKCIREQGDYIYNQNGMLVSHPGTADILKFHRLINDSMRVCGLSTQGHKATTAAKNAPSVAENVLLDEDESNPLPGLLKIV